MAVIAPARASATDLASEAYGDWASYLNDFAAERPTRLRIAQVTAARWRRLVRAPAPGGEYAIAFGRVLQHRGMVLEPEPYRSGSDWAIAARAGRLRGRGSVLAQLVRRR